MPLYTLTPDELRWRWSMLAARSRCPGRQQSGDIAVCRQLHPASQPHTWLSRTLAVGMRMVAYPGYSVWRLQTADSQQSCGRRLIQTTKLTKAKQIATECLVDTGHCWLVKLLIPKTTVLRGTIPVSIPPTFSAVSRYSVYRYWKP